MADGVDHNAESKLEQEEMSEVTGEGNTEAATRRITPRRYIDDDSDDSDDFDPLYTDSRELSAKLLQNESFCQAWINQRRITINAKDVYGNSCTFPQFDNCTVKELKEDIAERLHAQAEKCTLVYDGKELNDDSRLRELENIDEGSTFMLLPGRRNGIVHTVKRLAENFRTGLTNLVDWFPDVFRDVTRVLTERDLGSIAEAIGSGWQLLGNKLGLSKVNLDHINADNGSMLMKIYGMLSKWHTDNTAEATVGNLHSAMKKCSKVNFDWTAIERVFAGI